LTTWREDQRKKREGQYLQRKKVGDQGNEHKMRVMEAGTQENKGKANILELGRTK